jgi:hypothetical protein
LQVIRGISHRRVIRPCRSSFISRQCATVRRLHLLSMKQQATA